MILGAALFTAKLFQFYNVKSSHFFCVVFVYAIDVIRTIQRPS